MDGISSGIVFGWEPYNGSATPSATVLADRSRFGTNGAITGGTWARQASGLWALDFNPATPSYVEATCPQCNFTSEDFSIVVKVKIDDLTSDRIVFSRGHSSLGGYTLVADQYNRILFSTSQSGADQVSLAVDSIVSGSWFTIGISRSGASVGIYSNGIDVTSTLASHINPATYTDSGLVGVYYDKTGRPLDGQISFLRVYNRALSAGEHLQLHNELVKL